MKTIFSKRKIRIFVLFLIIVITSLYIPFWLAYQSAQHTKLNHLLMVYIEHDNTRGVIYALDRGANPNALMDILTNEDLKKIEEFNAINERKSNETGIAGFFSAMQDMFHRSSPATTGQEHRTVLMDAAWRGNFAMTKALLDKGADVNARSADGTTVLMYAVGRSKSETVELLLDKGAVTNAQNKFGHTPLYLAVASGNTEAVNLLLKRGADPNIKTVENKTPLIIAEQAKSSALITALKQAGAKE